jgi:pimeloyl-ACP methyl ester carboxylesterase
MARVVFLHGGPGFNSLPEQSMLGPLCRAGRLDTVFWNEPSRLRPDGDPFSVEKAFDNWLASATNFTVRAAEAGPVHIVAHSSTVHAALQITREHQDRVASLVLVAPSADNLTTFRNVLRIARDDLAPVNAELSATIDSALARTRAVLDAAMREGLLAAVQDEQLFTHYFVNSEQLQRTSAAWTQPGGQFDMESFLSVLADFGRRGASLLPGPVVTAPALVLFGAQDPITPMSEQVAPLLRALPDARVEVVDGCSHCLHLDRPQDFFERLLAWTGSIATPT